MISREEVKHIAKLARLGITEKEEEKFTKELSKILDYVEKLKEVAVSKVEPTSHLSTQAKRSVENVMRKDQVSRGDKKLIDGHLKVKSILWQLAKPIMD